MDFYEEIFMLSHIVYPFSNILIDALNGIDKSTLKGDPKLLELYRKLQNVLKVVEVTGINATSDVFRRLQVAISEGKAEKEFPVGARLPDIWTDPEMGIQYKMSHRVMSYQKVKLADGREVIGAILCRANILPKFREFDKESDYFAESSLRRYLNAEDGYLAGCSKELRNAIVEVEIGESYVEDRCRVCCSVFIPSVDEVGVCYDNDMCCENEIDRFSWQYFRKTPKYWGDRCAKRVFCDLKGAPQLVMLRSDNCSASISCVDMCGSVHGAKQRERWGVLPVSVVVGVDVKCN